MSFFQKKQTKDVDKIWLNFLQQHLPNLLSSSSSSSSSSSCSSSSSSCSSPSIPHSFSFSELETNIQTPDFFVHQHKQFIEQNVKKGRIPSWVRPLLWFVLLGSLSSGDQISSGWSSPLPDDLSLLIDIDGYQILSLKKKGKEKGKGEEQNEGEEEEEDEEEKKKFKVAKRSGEQAMRDIPRSCLTGREIQEWSEIMKEVFVCYAFFDPEVGYSGGMSFLARDLFRGFPLSFPSFSSLSPSPSPSSSQLTKKDFMILAFVKLFHSLGVRNLFRYEEKFSIISVLRSLIPKFCPKFQKWVDLEDYSSIMDSSLHRKALLLFVDGQFNSIPISLFIWDRVLFYGVSETFVATVAFIRLWENPPSPIPAQDWGHDYFGDFVQTVEKEHLLKMMDKMQEQVRNYLFGEWPQLFYVGCSSGVNVKGAKGNKN